ncbi:MAG: CDP-glycerol glycerophosphotransferase family protein [Sneathiella sp.]|nr:CDP-glycerol glycerophosphotransferase family protein [Sneathiella sp.]
MRQSLEKNSNDAGLLIQMGALLFSAGKAPEALLHLMRATIQRPDDPKLLMNIGFCLNSLGIHREAVRYFQATLDLGYEHIKLLEKMIASLSEIDRFDEITALLDKYKETSLASRSMLLLMVARFYLAGDYELAIETANRAKALMPDNLFTTAAIETVKAAIISQNNNQKSLKIRIAFHLNEQFHFSIMKPIFDSLKSHYDVVMTTDPAWVRDFKPDLVFVANMQAIKMRDMIPGAKFIYTRHGLISKNFVYEAASSCDFVCVSSEGQQKQFVEQGQFKKEQVWVTGYAQMDPLFWDKELSINLPLRPNHKCVLYAPTFTGGLSSIPMMLPNLNAAFFEHMKDVDFVIKTHPLTRHANADWISKLKEIAAKFDHVHLVDDIAPEIVPLLSRADVLISDVSSVMFQYLALNRPIIALNNPDRFTVKEYDPSGIEWLWRDMALEIENVSELASAVKECLSNPSVKQTRREEYRNSLFGTLTDGRTGQRVLEYVQNLQLTPKRGAND